MIQCKVKIYALSTCSHCKSAKELLTGCGVDYECVEVDKLDMEERKKILEEVREINTRCSFPTIIINDKVIVGYQEDAIKSALQL